VGPDVFPVIIGQYMDDSPMILVFANAAVIWASIILFQITFVASKFMDI